MISIFIFMTYFYGRKKLKSWSCIESLHNQSVLRRQHSLQVGKIILERKATAQSSSMDRGKDS